MTGSTLRSQNTQLSDADIKIIGKVEDLANKKGWKMAHVAMAWLKYKGISSPIIGFSKIDRIDEALGVKGKDLTEEEVKYLDEGYVPKNVIGHS